MNSLEITSKRNLTLLFGSAKFKLELRALTDEQCLHWAEFLRSKKALHSISDLINDLDGDAEFKTDAFRVLMKLKEFDQNQWIYDTISAPFESAQDELYRRGVLHDNLTTIKACLLSFEEFFKTCEECALEMDSRNPRIITHCRNYIQNYANCLKSRLILELQSILGLMNKRVMEIGESSLFAGIGLLSIIEELSCYRFLPKDFFLGLKGNLVNTGTLISAVLNIAIERVEGWFKASLLLPPAQRSRRLSEVNTLILEQISITKFPLLQQQRGCLAATKSTLQLTSLQLDLRKRIITNQLLNFCDLISTLSFSDYTEEGFIVHINSMNSCMENILVLATVSKKDESFLSDTIIDAVSSACISSIRRAIQWTVTKSSSGLDDITEVMIRDGKSMWLGGKVCRMYTDRLMKYLKFMAERIPPKYEPTLNAEVVRLTVSKYLMILMSRYREDKKIRLSKDGINQIISDLGSLQMFVTSNASAGTDKMAFYDETVITSQVRSFIKFEPSQILTAFAGALGSCGAPYGFHLYDLLRLCLKLRLDISSRDRRYTLGCCNKFLTDLDRVLVDEASFVVIPKGKFITRNILDDLFPDVGVRHCTGKKWSLEVPDSHMNDEILFEISTLVSDTYGDLKQKKIQSLKAKIEFTERNSLESIRQSVRIDNEILAAAVAEHDRILAEAAIASTSSSAEDFASNTTITQKPFEKMLLAETIPTPHCLSEGGIDVIIPLQNSIDDNFKSARHRPPNIVSTAESRETDNQNEKIAINVAGAIRPIEETRLFGNYVFDKSSLSTGNEEADELSLCKNCLRSTPPLPNTISDSLDAEVVLKSTESEIVNAKSTEGQFGDVETKRRPPPPPRKLAPHVPTSSVSHESTEIEIVKAKSTEKEEPDDRPLNKEGVRPRPPPPPRKLVSHEIGMVLETCESKRLDVDSSRPRPPPPPRRKESSISHSAPNTEGSTDSTSPSPPLPRKVTVPIGDTLEESSSIRNNDGTKKKPPPPPKLTPKF